MTVIFYQNDPCMAKMTVVHDRTVTSMLVTDVGDQNWHQHAFNVIQMHFMSQTLQIGHQHPFCHKHLKIVTKIKSST